MPSRALAGVGVLVAALALSACANLQLPANNPKPLFDKEKMASLDGRSVFASRHSAPVIASNGICAPAGASSFLLPQDLSFRRPPARRELTAPARCAKSATAAAIHGVCEANCTARRLQR